MQRFTHPCSLAAALPAEESHSPGALASLLERAGGLFKLLTATHGGSRRVASESIGRDLRAIRNAVDVPTLGHVANLGRALGLNSSEALAIIAHTDSRKKAFAALLEDVAAADIHDDASELERLALALAEHTEDSRSLSMSLLVHARASASRGNGEHAQAFARRALRMGCEREDALVRQLLQVIEGDVLVGADGALGSTVCAARSGEFGAQAPVAPGVGQTSRDTRPSTAVATRASCFASAQRVFASFPPPMNQATAGVVRGELIFLRSLLDRGSTERVGYQSSQAHVWAASIAACIAHRVLEHSWCDRTIEPLALGLAAQASLTLDDELQSAKNEVRTLACARRARLVLSEWMSRRARGEVREGALDESEIRELRGACIRFPHAFGSAALLAAYAPASEDFSKDVHLLLDTLS